MEHSRIAVRWGDRSLDKFYKNIMVIIFILTELKFKLVLQIIGDPFTRPPSLDHANGGNQPPCFLQSAGFFLLGIFNLFNSSFKPFIKRVLAFSRTSTSQYPFDANIFIDIRPMDSLSIPD